MTKAGKMFPDPPVCSEHGFPSVARDLLQEPALPHPEGKEALIPRPNPEAIIHLAENLRKIIFPGYLESGVPDPDTLQKKLDLGGNVWLTESVPPDTKVLMNRPDLIYLKN